MKIVFFGTPQYAADNLIEIVKSGYEVIAVVTQPDRKRNRGKKLSATPVKQVALDIGIPAYTTKSISKDQNLRELLYNLRADIYIVVAFGQILSKEILTQPKLGCWNSHASLLPAWRGAAPIQWSLTNDDARTGICIMAMDEGLDTGPVIEQETTEISDSDNLETLTNRLCNISSNLLIKSLKNIETTYGLSRSERLNKLDAIDQSKLKGHPSYARQIGKGDFLIDWNQNARKILKKIKGLYPNSYTLYKGKRIKILDAALIANTNDSIEYKIIKNESFKNKTPGEIIMINKLNGIMIMAKDIPIIIKYGKLEGKNKTDAYTLAAQSNISINCILGN